jgi:hypothetical protein
MHTASISAFKNTKHTLYATAANSWIHSPQIHRPAYYALPGTRHALPEPYSHTSCMQYANACTPDSVPGLMQTPESPP